MENNTTLKKKAASLAEVMIVLGIISTTLVASVSILISSLARTKINETEDAANSVMIQALEIAKSPVHNVSISSRSFVANQRGETYNFKLAQVEGQNVLEEVNEVSGNDCNQQNPYFVSNNQRENTNANLCLKISVKNITNQVYEIESTVTYEVPNEKKQNTIKGYRYGEF